MTATTPTNINSDKSTRIEGKTMKHIKSPLLVQQPRKKKEQNPSLRHGIINIIIHIPAVFATSFWGLLIIGIFNLWEPNSTFHYIILLLPLVIPPISCVAGIIRGFIFLKRDKYAKICLLLSAPGIFIYAGVIAMCGWLGSRY